MVAYKNDIQIQKKVAWQQAKIIREENHVR